MQIDTTNHSPAIQSPPQANASLPPAPRDSDGDADSGAEVRGAKPAGVGTVIDTRA